VTKGRDEYRRAARFRRALNQFLADADGAARAVGLTPQRYLLLLSIKASDHEQATISALADELGSAQSSVTELVDRAETAGLVERGKARDGRVVTVSLTTRGDDLFKQAFTAIKDDRERLLHHLDAAT
jgi:DNA-binding MarR family transcriptional regulator